MISAKVGSSGIAALLAMTAVPSNVQAASSCPAFRWTTLGTAGGPVPTIDRSEPANLLDAGDLLILVDTGDGTVTQMAGIERNPGEVRQIFISHLHWDHTGGLGALIGLRWMNNYESELTIYGPPGTREMVDAMIASLRPQERVGYGTGAAMPDPAANISVVELADGQEVMLDALTVTARGNTHFDQTLAEVGTVSFSYRFDMGNRSITYSGDTGPSTALTDLAKGTDMLVTEVIALEPLIAVMLKSRPDMPVPVQAAMRKHLSTHHVDASEVGRMAAQSGAGRVVLTHFAVPPGPLHDSEAYLRSGVRESYNGALDLSRDLSSFDVGCK